MRKISLIILMVAAICNAQEQQGYVKTVGKKGQRGEPLGGVILKTNYAKSSPVISSPDGKFSFTVSGNKFQMSKIQKSNYQLADEDVIGRDYSFTPKSPVVFAMVSMNEYRKDRKKFEEQALKKFELTFNQKNKQLQEEWERKKIDDNEYVQRTAELEQEYDSFQDMISKLSDLYARMDYDNIDSLNTLINQYTEEGKYDLAAALIDSKGGIKKRIADTKEREKNAAILHSIAERETQIAQHEKQSIISDLGVKIQDARNKMQLDSAQYWIECRADYDSTNVEYQIEALENILSYEYSSSILDTTAYWNHIDNNRRYIYRAIEYLKSSGKECSNETLLCFHLLNETYVQEYFLIDHFATREAMDIADKMIEVERKSGTPAVEGLSTFYSNLSYLLIFHCGIESQEFKTYYQKSLDERYYESALQLYKTVEDPYTLFSGRFY